MTNELEKQFFDAFGIKPKPIYSGSKLYNPFVTGYDYPTITDRILLELICILSKYQKDRGSLLEIDEISLDEIKEEILEMLIYRVDGCKHQVLTLFKEG